MNTRVLWTAVWEPRGLWIWRTEQQTVAYVKAHWNFPGRPSSKEFLPVEHMARQISPPFWLGPNNFFRLCFVFMQIELFSDLWRDRISTCSRAPKPPSINSFRPPFSDKPQGTVNVSSRFLFCGLLLLLTSTVCLHVLHLCLNTKAAWISPIYFMSQCRAWSQPNRESWSDLLMFGLAVG